MNTVRVLAIAISLALVVAVGAQAPVARALTPADTVAVRAWARENGVDIKERGRVPASVVAKYREATGN